MTSYDEFQAEVRRLKRERWLRIVSTEPVGRPGGRRPRDPEQERLLLALDRARLERLATDGKLAARFERSGGE